MEFELCSCCSSLLRCHVVRAERSRCARARGALDGREESGRGHGAENSGPSKEQAAGRRSQSHAVSRSDTQPHAHKSQRHNSETRAKVAR